MNKEIMKRLPFAETNVEGIELWLDQMALEGLFLCDTAGGTPDCYAEEHPGISGKESLKLSGTDLTK